MPRTVMFKLSVVGFSLLLACAPLTSVAEDLLPEMDVPEKLQDIEFAVTRTASNVSAASLICTNGNVIYRYEPVPDSTSTRVGLQNCGSVYATVQDTLGAQRFRSTTELLRPDTRLLLRITPDSTTFGAFPR